MIKIADLHFGYESSRDVLQQISFEAQPGECTAILGNNGAGKSTLIQCLNRILCPKRATVFMDGQDISQISRKNLARIMAYLPQRIDPWPLSVYDTVLLGRKPHSGISPKEQDYAIVESTLKQMQLQDLAMRPLSSLSGGEAQKVMLARALVQQPRILLLDEPISSLDLRNQHEMLSLVKELARQTPLCVIMVLHDLNLALRYCDKFVLLHNHRVHAFGGAEVLTPRLINEVYGLPVAIEQVRGHTTVVPLI